MRHEKGLTLVEVIVIGCVLVFSMAILIPACERRPRVRIAARVVCGTNLKGLGTAMTVYANDYEDRFPQLPGEGPWCKRLGFDYYLEEPDFGEAGAEERTSRTITASWYLLVRYADVSPKSFVCPRSSQTAFMGDNPYQRDITELWDFGGEPHKHVSYVLHNPYGKFPASPASGVAFAVAADMNPWFRNGDIRGCGDDGGGPQIIKADDETTWRLGNTWNHPLIRRGLFRDRRIEGASEGQSVLFGDGHTTYEKFTNCGVGGDNIYTFWSKENDPAAQDVQGGTNPTARDAENDAKSEDDSFLAI